MTISLADMAQGFALRKQGGAIKAEQQRLGTEMTTGVVADTSRHLRGNLTGIGAVDASLSRLGAFKAANAAATGLAGATQTALGAISGLADGLSMLLSDPTMTGSAAGVNAAAAEAHQRFISTVAILNTDFAGEPLFAGAGSGLALDGAEQILSALDTAVAGQQTAGGLMDAVDAWFDAPDGFAAHYQGEDARAAMSIGPDDSVRLDVTAMDAGLRDTLKSLALGALLDRGALAGNGAARQAVANASGEALITGKDHRLALQAKVGSVEAHLARAATRGASEASALSIARVGMVAADPYETAVRFEAVSTQLETLHAVTARMSKLALVDFL